MLVRHICVVFSLSDSETGSIYFVISSFSPRVFSLLLLFYLYASIYLYLDDLFLNVSISKMFQFFF